MGDYSVNGSQDWLQFPVAKRGEGLPSSATFSSISDSLNTKTPSRYEIKVKRLFCNLPHTELSSLSKIKSTRFLNCTGSISKDIDTKVSVNNERYILRNINFDAKSGELLGIAGPSGAGKTTILECLAGRVTPSSPPGCILVNDKIMDSSRFRRISGYVMQDDALFPTLTVLETLLFSARLRLSATVTMAEKMLRVQILLVELGLQHVANTRIGNDMIRGVSGGERRRVSIGVDVIHDPAVLILDEPTSGLDSGAAMNIVSMLRGMAVSRSRTVVFTIHQPNFRILKLMHSILVVAGGMVVHHGSMDFLEARLIAAGHEIPAQTTVLEYAIEAVNSWVQTEELLQEGSDLAKRGLTLQDIFPVGEDFRCHNQSDRGCHRGSPHQARTYCNLDLEQGPVTSREEGEDDELSDLECKISYPNNSLQETAILTERFFKNILRTRELFVARSIQALCAGVILGTVFLKLGNDQQGVKGRLGFFVFTITFLLNSTCEALPIFLQERQILLRETSRGAYRISSYVLSHSMVFIPFFIPIAILYGAPSYWLAGLTSSTESILFYCLVLWLTLLLANSFVAFFSALVPNYIMGQALVAACMGAFFLFSGYIINSHDIPKYWIWMNYISLFKYPYEALLLNEFQPHLTECYDAVSATNPTADRASLNCLLTGSQVLDNSGVEEHRKWNDVIVMVGLIVFYRIICYVTVCWRFSRSRR